MRRNMLLSLMENPFFPGYFESHELRALGFKSVGENVRIAKNSTIVGLENIEIGDNSRIDGFCTIVASGGRLRIGEYVHIHTSCVLGCRGTIEIGDFSSLSHGVQVLSASDDLTGDWMFASAVPERFTRPRIAPIVIGTHVPLACGCTVLPGVDIPDGAGAGPHSLIRKSLEPWTMYHGNPAKPIRVRSRAALQMEAAIKASLLSNVA